MDKKFIYIGGGGLLVVIILIIVLVVGKGKTEKPVTQNSIMTIWDYNNQKKVYDPVINSYQIKKNIKINYVVKNIATYQEDAVAAMVAGKGPDVWILPSNMVAKNKNILEPMPINGYADNANKKDDIEVYSEMYPQFVVQDNILDNRVYGTPIAGEKLKLFVNSDLVSKSISAYNKSNPSVDTNTVSSTANNPRTWDDLVQAIRIITQKNNGKINTAAIAMGTSNNISTSNDILTLLMIQNGAKMVSDDLSISQFHTSQNLFGDIQYPGTKALEFYTSFANPKSENYTWNATMPSAIRAFAGGQTAMLIEYESAKAEIENINPDLKYQVVNVPQIKETKNPAYMIKYDTLVVPKSSKIQGVAWRFVLTAATGVTMDDKSALKNSGDKEIINGKTWYNPDPNKVKAIFNETITQVSNGGDAQTAMDGAASQITTLLGKLKNQ